MNTSGRSNPPQSGRELGTLEFRRGRGFCLPQRGHDFQAVQEAGCSGKENGELVALADKKFEVLVTSEKNIRHQQNLGGKKIAVLVLRSTSHDVDDLRQRLRAALTVAADDGCQP